MKKIILELQSINKTFTKTSFFGKEISSIHALENVSFTLAANSTLGIVGESGSGKSTCAKIISKLLEQDSGSVVICGKDHRSINKQAFSKTVQMIFQDPYSSLNPSLPIGIQLEEAVLEQNRAGRNAKISAMLHELGLENCTKILKSYPHQFSGGQRQRLAFARALLKEPRILICDEPFSALDMTTQKTMVSLLEKIKKKMEISILFISHDITLTASICDRIVVMKDGAIVEEEKPGKLLSKPGHEYTKKLIASVPVI